MLETGGAPAQPDHGEATESSSVTPWTLKNKSTFSHSLPSPLSLSYFLSLSRALSLPVSLLPSYTPFSLLPFMQQESSDI